METNAKKLDRMRFETTINDMIQIVSVISDIGNGRWVPAIMSNLLDDMPAAENYVVCSIRISKLREAAGAETQITYRDTNYCC